MDPWASQALGPSELAYPQPSTPSVILHQGAKHGDCLIQPSCFINYFKCTCPTTSFRKSSRLPWFCKAFPDWLPPAGPPGLGSHRSYPHSTHQVILCLLEGPCPLSSPHTSPWGWGCQEGRAEAPLQPQNLGQHAAGAPYLFAGKWSSDHMCLQGRQVQSHEDGRAAAPPTHTGEQTANPLGTSDLHAAHLGVGMALLLTIPLLL